MHVQLKIYVLTILFFAIVLLSLFYYVNAAALLTDDNAVRTSEAVSQSAEYISAYLEKLKAMSDVIAMDEDTKLFLKDSTAIEEAQVTALMEVILAGDSKIMSIALISRDGDSIVVGQDMAMTLSQDMMDQDWYMEAKNSHQMPALNATRMSDFTMDKNKWVVSISREVVDEDQEHLGVLLMDLEYRFFESYFQSMDLGEKGYAFIIDDQGHVIYHPDENYFIDQNKAKSLIDLLGKTRVSTSKGDLLKYQKTIGHSTWTLVGLSSLENVELLKRELYFSILLVGGIIFIIALFGSAFISNKLTRPIELLEKSMTNLSKNWQLVESSGSFEEVEHLREAYNQLILEIKRLMEDIKAQEQLTRQHEIKALQSQINPHFLYNTLDTIVWLAEFDASDQIVDVTKSLSGLLRVALKKDQGITTVEEEFEHVKHYLKIQKMRYEDILSFSFDLQQDVKPIRIPKLIVQPIVENAIYHGIRPLGDPGYIKVSAYLKDDHLEILVEDSGVGFEDKEKISVEIGGVGIENVHQRIQLIAGKAYGLEVIHKKQPTQVIIKLPLDL